MHINRVKDVQLLFRATGARLKCRCRTCLWKQKHKIEETTTTAIPLKVVPRRSILPKQPRLDPKARKGPCVEKSDSLISWACLKKKRRLYLMGMHRVEGRLFLMALSREERPMKMTTSSQIENVISSASAKKQARIVYATA